LCRHHARAQLQWQQPAFVRESARTLEVAPVRLAREQEVDERAQRQSLAEPRPFAEPAGEEQRSRGVRVGCL
jgi:hypothetical protein